MRYVHNQESEHIERDAHEGHAPSGRGAEVFVDQVGDEKGNGKDKHAARVRDGLNRRVTPEDRDVEGKRERKELDAHNIADHEAGTREGGEPQIQELGWGERRRSFEHRHAGKNREVVAGLTSIKQGAGVCLGELLHWDA